MRGPFTYQGVGHRRYEVRSRATGHLFGTVVRIERGLWRALLPDGTATAWDARLRWEAAKMLKQVAGHAGDGGRR